MYIQMIHSRIRVEIECSMSVVIRNNAYTNCKYRLSVIEYGGRFKIIEDHLKDGYFAAVALRFQFRCLREIWTSFLDKQGEIFRRFFYKLIILVSVQRLEFERWSSFF